MSVRRSASEPVRWAHVALDESSSAVKVHRKMEQMFTGQADMLVTPIFLPDESVDTQHVAKA